KPETPHHFQVHFTLNVMGVPIGYTKDVIYKRTDPVDGEVYRPFEVIPPVFANIENTVYVYADNQPQTVRVVIKSGKAGIKGKATIFKPIGWRIEPEYIDFDLALKEAETTLSFQLFPPDRQSEAELAALVQLEDGTVHSQGITIIEYDHIPTQTVVQTQRAKVVKIELEKRGDRIGYIMGAGDDVPTALEQIGYQVDLLEDKDITLQNLKQYDAVVLGVRAYNTNERLKFQNPILLEYTKQGGTMLVQYNTTRRLKVPSAELGPYPMKLSRDRVAVEEAEVRLLAPEHPVLNTPNKITTADFEGWVQERGLYFPNEWDEQYTPILSSNDPDEPARDGGLLVAKYGKGYYIYSGYSWFRELPAGVPGAFRLFANLVSIGKE
ncbi:MAG: LmbE family protein, partial [Bacteroidota bacterium]